MSTGTPKRAKKAVVKLAWEISAADLKRLGFKPDKEEKPAVEHDRKLFPSSAMTGTDEDYSQFVKGNIRVCQHEEDGFEVFAFDEGLDGQWKGTTNGGLDWQTNFSMGTPAEFVMSFLFKVTGG